MKQNKESAIKKYKSLQKATTTKSVEKASSSLKGSQEKKIKAELVASKSVKAIAKESETKPPKIKWTDEEKVEDAIEETLLADEAVKEELAIQKEIQEDIVKEAAQTSKLVRDDFTPLNSNREKLIREYAPLIKYIAQRIAARLPSNIELDDLMSSGVIGLMDAIDKYDPTRDNKFKTYAEFRIRGAILDELRAQDWVPRSVREKAKVLERCYARIEQEKGRQATDDEVCQELNLSQNEFHDLLNQVRSVSLLSFDDLTSFSSAEKRFLHGYGDNQVSAATPLNEVTTAGVKKIIAEAITDLPEKQRLVLSLYYYEDLNLKEIGKVLDVTESRVSQLHTQAVLRLKARLRNHWDEFVNLMSSS